MIKNTSISYIYKSRMGVKYSMIMQKKKKKVFFKINCFSVEIFTVA